MNNNNFEKNNNQNRSQDITMYQFVKIHSIWRIFNFVTEFIQKFKIKKKTKNEKAENKLALVKILKYD